MLSSLTSICQGWTARMPLWKCVRYITLAHTLAHKPFSHTLSLTHNLLHPLTYSFTNSHTSYSHPRLGSGVLSLVSAGVMRNSWSSFSTLERTTSYKNQRKRIHWLTYCWPVWKWWLYLMRHNNVSLRQYHRWAGNRIEMVTRSVMLRWFVGNIG